MKLVIFTLFFCSCAECFLLLRLRRVAASSSLGSGPGTTIKYVRRTASGAAGSSLGTTAKYL
jgi:hypothetical protein